MTTLYEYVGGDQWFVDLVDRFFDEVERDPIVRPLYPDDLAEPKENMVGFLVQFWGGPATYSERKGHPRLRMRHMPFVIGVAERDAWFDDIVAAVRGGGLEPEVERQVIDYFDNAATAMINQ